MIEGIAWKRLSPIDSEKHVYERAGSRVVVAFEAGFILPRTTANTLQAARVLETFNATISHLNLFDNKRDAIEELIVVENFNPKN